MKLFKFIILFIPFYSTAQKVYFQQDVAYTIHVSLNDVKHELNGNIEIRYQNNSPDTLRQIYFHLWPNAYKNKKTPLAKQLLSQGENRMVVARPADFGWIDKLDFKIDGQPVAWELLQDTLDVALLHLPFLLYPK